MTFDPSDLRRASQQKNKTAPVKGTRKKGQKRPREEATDRPRKGPGETSGVGVSIARAATPPVAPSRPRDTPLVVDLDDEVSLPTPQPTIPEETCQLIPELFWKYRADELSIGEGVKVVETFALKALTVARALSSRGSSEAQKVAGLEAEVDSRGRRIMELEAEQAAMDARINELQAGLRKARDELGVAKDEAEDAKLELEAKTKEFEAAIDDARSKAVEDFKKSEEFGALRGEYAMGSYNYAFKQARAYLRSKMPDVSPADLVADPEVLDNLELSSSETTLIEGEESAAEEEVDRPPSPADLS